MQYVVVRGTLAEERRAMPHWQSLSACTRKSSMKTTATLHFLRLPRQPLAKKHAPSKKNEICQGVCLKVPCTWHIEHASHLAGTG
eukprot:4589904-Amphidinium_carterae.3